MSGMAFRLLVTGSRDWDDVGTIRAALDQALHSAGERPLVVVHGACASGADWHANHVALWMRGQGLPVDVEQHPAGGHASEFGRWPGAGPRRNKYMVSLGANACAAFIGPCTRPRCKVAGPHGSHGATGCADLAEAAGIPTRRWAT
ncbi:hypothetical protein HY68_01455 [Streptomyces sp. AcH 505]|nr:hypothetical protein HY68_01455 [Streptomyces sp. AcH 505]